MKLKRDLSEGTLTNRILKPCWKFSLSSYIFSKKHFVRPSLNDNFTSFDVSRKSRRALRVVAYPNVSTLKLGSDRRGFDKERTPFTVNTNTKQRRTVTFVLSSFCVDDLVLRTKY